MMHLGIRIFFFFKQKTAYDMRISDWSSDVCSSDLLDALYFILYGVFDPANPAQSRDDIRYIYSTFPIVEREETAKYGHYRSRDLGLAWINALIAGQPDADVDG